MPRSASLPVPWLFAVASVMAEEEEKKKQMLKRLIPALFFFIPGTQGASRDCLLFYKRKRKEPIQRWNMGLSLHWSSQFWGGGMAKEATIFYKRL